MQIGKSVRRMRHDRKISQKDLAESAHLSPAFLSLIENDRRTPSLATLAKLARALSVPVEVLWWDALELPAELPEQDRRLCEIAKLLVRRCYSDEPKRRRRT